MKSKHFLIVSAVFLLTTGGLVTLLDSTKLMIHSHQHPDSKSIVASPDQQHLNHSVRSSLPKGLGWNFFDHPESSKESDD